MIRLNENFETHRDKYEWILYEEKDTVSKATGKPRKTKKKTYHGTLSGVVDYVIDRECGTCKDLSEIRDLLVKASAYRLCEVVEEAGEEAWVKSLLKEE